MSIANLSLYFFEALAALAATGILFLRNVFYAALLLIVCLLAIAGIYVLSWAEFLATAQVLIYAGGILVVVVFAIMLTTKIGGKPLQVENHHLFPASLAGLFFASLLFRLFSQINVTPPTPKPEDAYHRVGVLLMTDYALPFEIAGVLLVISLVGAAVIASSPKSTHGTH